MKICVFGIGYVGLSLSVLLSKLHTVTAIDVQKDKVDMINSGVPTVYDKEINKEFMNSKHLFKATVDINNAIGSDYAIIATPTNYDVTTNSFDTTSVDTVIKEMNKVSPETVMVIKSTVPIGYTLKKYNEGYRNVIMSPEFLREGKALYDNLHPSRIVVGIPSNELNKAAKIFAEMLHDAAIDDSPVLLMNSTEAESIKLFSNTYLAMRVAFFNELDTFAEINKLDSKSMIDGICKDPRIGEYYNNPSFGYGGYCLPKDTKQLLSNYSGTPNELMGAIVKSNMTRKKFIAESIINMLNGKNTVGVYRLSMKMNSDNCRESSILDVIDLLIDSKINVLIFDPNIVINKKGCTIKTNIDQFVSESDIIIANRVDKLILSKAKDKIYSRDLYCRD